MFSLTPAFCFLNFDMETALNLYEKYTTLTADSKTTRRLKTYSR